MDKFKDIRPYRDDEIRPIIDRLLGDREFLDSIAGFYAPLLSRLFPGVLRLFARRLLVKQTAAIHNVKTMQDVIAVYMDKMIEDTTTSLTHSGLDELDAKRSYLFLCNHRDITMDPAFVNYVLYHAGMDTVEIATGDNLFKKEFVSDLMRLNKSFIVRRSLKGRELLQSLSLLSQYIHFCIGNHQNVWIAQREGRAKDGNDCTDPALLKMLAMGRRDLSFSESLRELHIVPVAISYEYDACDELKAQELYQIETTGSFTKTEKSDIQSIVKGMIGFKGRVHIAFGHELVPTTNDPDELAEEIDRQIISNYRLQDTNYLALQLLKERGWLHAEDMELDISGKSIDQQVRLTFERRLQGIDSNLHKTLLYSYANPVINALKLADSE